MTMLQDDEWKAWSDNAIASQCKVHHSTVAKIRAEVTCYLASEKSTERTYTNKHGTKSTMKVAAIGKQQQEGVPDDYDPRDDDLAEARNANDRSANANK